MASSLKTNIILNAIRTFCSIAFPVLTFAYVARILDVQGIGMFDYARSIVSYFSLIAQLGVSTYGMREIPKVKDDKEKLSKLVFELFSFNLIATLISYILFFITLFEIEEFNEYRMLLLINGLSIGFCALGLEWLYGALEEYKYITLRTLLFQVLSFILLLVFVNDKSDIYIYAAINVFSSVGSNILNFFNARKYLIKPKFSYKNILSHAKPIFIFWGNNIASSLYLLIGTTILGYVCSDYSVGLYSASNKICRICITLVASICPILLTRSSSYLSLGKNSQYFDLAQKSFDIVMFLSIPIFVFLFCFSKDIILIFSGTSFLPATNLSQIMSVLMILMPISTFLSMQILIPFGKESIVLKVLIFVTFCNAILSYIFIPVYKHIAAAYINVFTELLILIIYFVVSCKIVVILSIIKHIWHYSLAGLFQFICVYIIYNSRTVDIDFLNLLVSLIVGSVIYLFILYQLKDEILKTIYANVVSRYNRN